MEQERNKNKKLENLYKTKGSCCHYCTKNTPFIHITKDHVYPKSSGFTLDNNWVFSCRSCNTKKGNMHPKVYITFLISKIVVILKKIAQNNFIATQSQVDKIKFHHGIMMQTKQLI